MTVFLFLTLLIMGCSKQKAQDNDLERCNSVYYWRTDLRLDSTEKAFLSQYDIKKVYCRYFDVVMNDDASEPSPNATISFSEPLPASIEMIPTVYITEDCMHKPYKGLAKKIVDRILQMNETNDIKGSGCQSRLAMISLKRLHGRDGVTSATGLCPLVRGIVDAYLYQGRLQALFLSRGNNADQSIESGHCIAVNPPIRSSESHELRHLY